MKKEELFNLLFLVAAVLMFVTWQWSNPRRAEPAEINMDIISDIESSGRADAYNPRSGATGKWQITSVALIDYNTYNHTSLTLDDMYDPDACFVVADWYMGRCERLLKHYNVPQDLKYILYAYNWGPKNVSTWYHNGAVYTKLPKETQNYYKKYLTLERHLIY